MPVDLPLRKTFTPKAMTPDARYRRLLDHGSAILAALCFVMVFAECALLTPPARGSGLDVAAYETMLQAP